MFRVSGRGESEVSRWSCFWVGGIGSGECGGLGIEVVIVTFF